MKVALVTGANRGIGLETSRQLLARGLRVVMSGRDESAVQRAASGIGAEAVRMDVTDPASIAAAHRAIGDVDVLVNNAAILLAENEDTLAISADDWHRTFETNLFGVIEVCRVFVPPMRARGSGRVVNVSSGAAFANSTYAPAYSVSKAALNAFTRVLAATCRGDGVLVNAVDPGWVRTDMGGPSAPRSVKEGAETIVWLATLPDDGPTGGFFKDRRLLT